MFRKTNPLSRLLNLTAKSLLAFSLLFTICFSANAQGDLLITPKRVVFEGSKRAENLNLANIGKDSATYTISFVQIRMKEDGSFEKIETPDPGQMFAEPYLRVFPRTVTLAPNEAQTVKLQVRKSGSMPTGEYRSHIYFRAVPKQKPLGEKEKTKDSTIGVKLTPIYGITIPAIIRVGESTAQVQLEEATLNLEKSPGLRVAFTRSGNMSVYGDITVNHISSQGVTTKVGSVKGFAVYTPNTRRYFTIPLDPAANVDYHSGKLQVVYTDSSPKAQTLAEKEITLK